MCIRDRAGPVTRESAQETKAPDAPSDMIERPVALPGTAQSCLLYTSDAADERSSVDLGGRRILTKKNKKNKKKIRSSLTISEVPDTAVTSH